MSTRDADLPQADTSDVVVTECDLPEAPAKVWKALTVPALLAGWLPEAIESEILEAVPDKLLRYRWADDKAVAGRPLESVVSFELTGTTDGGTHLRVVHRVLEAARVIPFAVRRKAPVAMGGASGRLAQLLRPAPASSVVSPILLRRAA
jgi:uncharacterized protein YndB with AHSA1/START domain